MSDRSPIDVWPSVAGPPHGSTLPAVRVPLLRVLVAREAGAETYDWDCSFYGPGSRFTIASPTSLREELLALVGDALREEPGGGRHA